MTPTLYSILARTVITDGACWRWTGAHNSDGYGVVRTPDGLRLAHRVVSALLFGPIPAGIVVCHTCDVRDCLNPAHHWRGTQAENLRDMCAKGRSGPQNKQRKSARGSRAVARSVVSSVVR